MTASRLRPRTSDLKQASGHPHAAQRDRRGAMLVLVAMMLVILIVTVVFSVDVAYMQLTRTQMRCSTDAAARAASEALSRTQQTSVARQAAIDCAAKNPVANAPLVLEDEDVEFGRATMSTSGAISFVSGTQPFNSVKVTGRRTNDSAGGRVSLFVGGLLGVHDFQIVNSSTTMTLDRDVCLVVDRSGSMKTGLTSDSIPGGLGSCDPPHSSLSRWSALAVAVQSFIDGVEETPQMELMSLVSYASAGTYCSRAFNAADIETNLSDDYQMIVNAMADLSSIPINGYTNIAAGIDLGAQVLIDPDYSRPLAEKTMVVLTDGQYNRGRHPAEAAADAAKLGITIHAVTFSSGADQEAMIAAAKASGGKHYHAPDAATLDAIFREIALTLPVVLTE